MPFRIEEATTEDAGAIAEILISDEGSEFLRLQLEGMEKKDQVYIVARDQETGEIVAYATWVLPKENVVKTSEEKARELEEFRGKLIPGMNVPLIMDIKTGLDDLRESVLRGKRHYYLGNIGTLPSHRRQGAASALTLWPFEKADNDHLLVFLETDEAGGARRMYEKLGFERKDAVVFDLSKYGGRGLHTHIAMIREPRAPS